MPPPRLHYNQRTAAVMIRLLLIQVNMLETLSQRLTALPYFRALPPGRAANLARQLQERSLSAGETLFLQDQPTAGLWIIEEGQVKIYRLHPDGREHIVLLVGPGESFNEIPAIDGRPNPASAMALSLVRAWNLPHAILRREIETDPRLALAVIDILTERTRQLVQRIEDLALCSVTARLARFLLNQHTHDAPRGPGITRVTIAAHLATTPETISRALRTLEDLGAIQFTREQVTVTRLDLLRALAMQ